MLAYQASGMEHPGGRQHPYCGHQCHTIDTVQPKANPNPKQGFEPEK